MTDGESRLVGDQDHFLGAPSWRSQPSSDQEAMQPLGWCMSNKPLPRMCLFGHSAVTRLAMRQEWSAGGSGRLWLSSPCSAAPVTELHHLGAVIAQGLLANADL